MHLATLYSEQISIANLSLKFIDLRISHESFSLTIFEIIINNLINFTTIATNINKRNFAMDIYNSISYSTIINIHFSNTQ